MSFRLQSQIAIGKYAFSGGVNEVKINRSVKETVDTAHIKIPAVGRSSSLKSVALSVAALLGVANVKNSPDDHPVSSVETSTLWQEGDKVNILLGYNGDLRQEFKGFVRRVSPSIPVLIECEGYAWQLRRKQFKGFSSKSIQLIDFLKGLVEGTDIKLSPYMSPVTLTGLCIKQGNALSALEQLKKHSHLSAYFDFDVLFVGLEEVQPGKKVTEVKYRLGWNTVRDDKLKYRLADNTNVLIKFILGKGKNKQRPVFEFGDKNGSIITEHIAGIVDKAHLQAIANQQLLNKKYTGFEGGITCFLHPYCQPTDTAVIIDKKYNVRSGNYFVDGIEIVFGMGGARRIVYVTHALNTPQYVALINNNDNSAQLV